MPLTLTEPCVPVNVGLETVPAAVPLTETVANLPVKVELTLPAGVYEPEALSSKARARSAERSPNSCHVFPL